MTYREPTECAECGQMLKKHGFHHEKGVYHQQHKRIVALLKEPCMTLEDIATRLGVTRERVGQIGEIIGMPGGWERRSLCVARRIPQRLRKSEIFASFEKEVLEQGFTLNYLRRPDVNAAYKRLSIVNGWRCLLRQGKSNQKHIMISGCRHRDYDFDFVVYRIMPLGKWLIVPKERASKNLTMFAISPAPNGNGQSMSKRHDWRDYLDNWEPLRQPK